MDFILKKLISALVQPLNLSLLLGVIGIVLLWFNHYLRLSKILLTCSLAILLFFSFNWFSLHLLRGLERQYPPLTEIPKNIETIVVLGGGIGGNIRYPANTRINSASLSRLIEGIRLYRLLQQKGVKPTLILSGGRIFRTHGTEAEKMKNTAVILGVDQPRLIIENGSLDTEQEAIYLKPQIKGKPFILVTSAAHMPRAVALFKKQGMQPIPAPTQYLGIRNPDPVKNYLPNSNYLIFSDIALHEYLGILWSKLRHQL